MQYIEENDRLRAILGEWSARAAKVHWLKFCCGLSYTSIISHCFACVQQLERALEAEQISSIELRKNIAKLRGQTYKDQNT